MVYSGPAALLDTSGVGSAEGTGVSVKVATRDWCWLKVRVWFFLHVRHKNHAGDPHIRFFEPVGER